MLLRLIRNATLLIDFASSRLLIDPMLNPAGAVDPVSNTANPRRNPLVELPVPAEEVLADVDVVLVTHLHNDHFDAMAGQLRAHVEAAGLGDRVRIPADGEALTWGHGFYVSHP